MYRDLMEIVRQDRKHIVKILKPHVVRMCSDEEAQLVLFTALDIIECAPLYCCVLLF
jgi:hypothetical protein